METKAILHEQCYHEGRGPQLERAHYGPNGCTLKAVDYLNPDHSSREDLKHLLFERAQVFMFTPEEVHNDDQVDWSKTDNAAVVCLGKSAWLLSFNPQHLAKCQHYQIMFYDDILDSAKALP